MSELNFHCPVCGALSRMVIGPTQAFCTNRETCDVITFDPSNTEPDRGLSHMHFLDLSEAFEKKKDEQ
jgi:hypothetical protein